MRNKVIPFIIFFIICQGAGGIGSMFTIPEIHGWYAQLVKPGFTPPNWLFAPAWTLLFTLMAAALFIVWHSNRQEGKFAAFAAFGAQLVLNVAWSAVFFGGHMLAGGFFVIMGLWLAIAVTIYRFHLVSPLAAWLMVPYLCWVTFAGILNLYFWRLNM